MAVSPLNLRQPQFRSAFRGFDKIEVSSFLLALADDYERALRDTERLRQDLERVESALIQHRNNERRLRANLSEVQKLVDEMRKATV